MYCTYVCIREWSMNTCRCVYLSSHSFQSSSPTCLLHSSINPASPPVLAVLLALSPAYPPQPAQPNHMTSAILLYDIEEGTCCYTLSKKYISYIRIYISIYSYLYTVVNNLSIYIYICKEHVNSLKSTYLLILTASNKTTDAVYENEREIEQKNGPKQNAIVNYNETVNIAITITAFISFTLFIHRMYTLFQIGSFSPIRPVEI